MMHRKDVKSVNPESSFHEEKHFFSFFPFYYIYNFPRDLGFLFKAYCWFYGGDLLAFSSVWTGLRAFTMEPELPPLENSF